MFLLVLGSIVGYHLISKEINILYDIHNLITTDNQFILRVLKVQLFF